jgi:hypothetical protein
MKRTHLLFVFAIASAIAAGALADSSTFLTVPNHGEEALTWCGAAVGQMIVGGYPSGACTVTQTDMWDAIQTYKTDPAWETDPDGLRGALYNLCHPSGGWSVVPNADPATVMYNVAHYMNANHYPVAVLLGNTAHNAVTGHREHWVVVKGIVTNVAPTSSPVTLNYILIYDFAPALATSAIERFLTGTQWYGEFSAATLGTTYAGKYVAVIEPPLLSGQLTAPRRMVTGPVIAPQRAVDAARRALASTLVNVASFRDAANLQPQPPILVNPERGGYYIVPFAAAGTDSTLSVLINAYDGTFLEAGRHKARRPMMTDREALSRASQLLRVPGANMRAIAVRDGESPYFPSWRVTAGNEEIVIDPEGSVRRVMAPPR